MRKPVKRGRFGSSAQVFGRAWALHDSYAVLNSVLRFVPRKYIRLYIFICICFGSLGISLVQVSVLDFLMLPSQIFVSCFGLDAGASEGLPRPRCCRTVGKCKYVKHFGLQPPNSCIEDPQPSGLQAPQSLTLWLPHNRVLAVEPLQVSTCKLLSISSNKTPSSSGFQQECTERAQKKANQNPYRPRVLKITQPRTDSDNRPNPQTQSIEPGAYKLYPHAPDLPDPLVESY